MSPLSDRAAPSRGGDLIPDGCDDDESLASELADLEARVRRSAPNPGSPPSPPPPGDEFRWLGGSFVSFGDSRVDMPRDEGFPAIATPGGDARSAASPPSAQSPDSPTSVASPALLSPKRAPDKRRRAALVDLVRRLQSLAAAAEQEHAKRLKLRKARVPATVLLLEDRVDDHRKVRLASGAALKALRDGGDLGPGGGAAHAAILEAAVAVADDDDLVLDGAVVAALRDDVDRHAKAVRRALRKADRATARHRDAASPPRAELQRGSGFSEIRHRPRPRPPMYHGPGHNHSDREYADVLVVRKKDGLAVIRPHYLKEPSPPKGRSNFSFGAGDAGEISRHCRYVPSSDDLSSLAL